MNPWPPPHFITKDKWPSTGDPLVVLFCWIKFVQMYWFWTRLLIKQLTLQWKDTKKATLRTKSRGRRGGARSFLQTLVDNCGRSPHCPPPSQQGDVFILKKGLCSWACRWEEQACSDDPLNYLFCIISDYGCTDVLVVITLVVPDKEQLLTVKKK